MTGNTPFHVFLSHNSVDKPQVEQIAHRLRDEGVEVWLDKWNLIPGEPWQEGIEVALDDCDCCLVFVGKEGNIGPWQNVEMRAAIDHQVCTQRLRVIPVLLPGSERGDPSQLPTFLRRNTWVEFRYSLDEPDTFARLVAGINREKPPIEGALVNRENPYRGLEVFDVEHSQFFFGRSAVVEWLLNEIRPSESGDSSARFRDNRFLAIIGASGGGKSSVARAGLLAALRNGQLPNSANWPQVDFTPGEKPLQSLALALKKHPELPSIYQVEHTKLRSKFLNEPLQLHYLALEWLKGDGRRRLVILADQFEEIFTLCRDDVERQAFLDNLLKAAYESTGQVIVILTFRADFYPSLTLYEQLSRAVEAHQYLLNPLNKTELREAIIMPAQLSGAEVEGVLVDDLVKDALEQPGSLPLLQFALGRLWDECSQRVLQLQDYRQFGGLAGVLEQQANKVYEWEDYSRKVKRSDKSQAQIRLVFRRLVQPGDGTTDTRRRARLDEFSEKQQSIVRLMASEKVRLLTTQRKERKEFVEVAHEALIGGWPRLKDWVNEDRASIQTQHLVSSAAKEWESKGRMVRGLLPEARLLDAEQWVGDYPEQSNLVEKAFVESEGRVVRRQRNRVKWFAGVMGVVAVAMVVLAWLLFERSNELSEAQQQTAVTLEKEEIARKEAENNAKQAKQRELKANYNLAKVLEEKSLSQLIKSSNFSPTNSKWQRIQRDSLLYFFEAQRHPIPEGMTTLDSSTFDELSIIDARVLTPELSKVKIKELLTAPYKAIHRPDGNAIAIILNESEVRIIDTLTGELIKSISPKKGSLDNLAYSQDGNDLAIKNKNGDIYIWNIDKEKLRTIKGKNKYNSNILAYSPYNDILASGGGLEELT